MNENSPVMPVDQAMANLNRRFLWDDEFAQYHQITEEEQRLRDQRRRQPKQKH